MIQYSEYSENTALYLRTPYSTMAAMTRVVLVSGDGTYQRGRNALEARGSSELPSASAQTKNT